jgi:hypothetical protein
MRSFTSDAICELKNSLRPALEVKVRCVYQYMSSTNLASFALLQKTACFFQVGEVLSKSYLGHRENK